MEGRQSALMRQRFASFTANESPSDFNPATDLIEANERILSLVNELDYKNRDIRSLEESKMKLHKEVMELSQSRQRLKSEDGFCTKEKSDLQKAIRTLTAHRDSKHLLNEKLSQQLTESLSKNETLRDQNLKLQAQIEEKDELISRLSRENDELRATGSVAGENDELIQKLLSEIAELNNELDNVHSEISSTQQLYQDKLRDADVQLDYLRTRLQASEAKSFLSSDPDVVSVIETFKSLKERNEVLFGLIARLIRHDDSVGLDERQRNGRRSILKTAHSPASHQPPPLTIMDAIYLLEAGFLTLHCPDQSTVDADKEEDDYFLLHGRNPEEVANRHTDFAHTTPSSKTSQGRHRYLREDYSERPSVSECTLRLVDFMEQHQVLVIASYLCSTPLLTATGGTDSVDGVVMNIGESPLKKLGGSLVGSGSAPAGNMSTMIKRVHIHDESSHIYVEDDDEAARLSDEDDGSEHKHPDESEDRLQLLQRMEVDLLAAMNSVAARGVHNHEAHEHSNDLNLRHDAGESLDESLDESIYDDDESVPVARGLEKGEHVCFTIHRDNGGPDEVWIEVVDEVSGCPYYFNPDTQETQWELPSEIEQTLIAPPSQELLLGDGGDNEPASAWFQGDEEQEDAENISRFSRVLRGS